MPAARNPFFIRTAEQAESDDQFLNLFSLPVLELLSEDGSWNRFLPIESPPGGGKSTLLRLFTPTVLRSVYNARGRQEFRELISTLTRIDVLDDTGVQLIGVLVNCREDYSRISDLPVAPSVHKSLFRALLHGRLALLTIRAALQLAGLSFPADVHLVRFEPRNALTLRRPDARIVNGRDLFERARIIEELIVNSLNSFAPRPPSQPDGLVVDDFFQLINTHQIFVGDHPAARNTLIMFDDAHSLDVEQRKLLISELERHDQTSFASWMAMRLRALDPEQLMTEEEVRSGRERHPPMRFDGSSHVQIEKWMLDVGDRRARRAERDVSSFAGCLADSLTAEFDSQRLKSIADAERERAHLLAKPHGDLYRNWIDDTESTLASSLPLDQAIGWARIQILMERRIRRLQAEFDFGSLGAIDVDSAGPSTLEPATMFMCRRNNLPYFFGAKTIAKLASTNVEQFLSLSATLFDRLLNSGSRRRHHLHELLPSEQHRLVLAESRAYVDEIRTSLPYGQDVYNLVTAIAKLSREESLRPNVPIAPGVTGVSLQISERDDLIASAQSYHPDSLRLINAISSAIAHNALSIRVTDRHRDEDRIVFYLNRLVCPAYDLPLGFGGYKPRKLLEFHQWITSGTPTRQSRLGIP